MDVLRGQYQFRYDFHVTSSSNNNEGCSVKIGVNWHAETKARNQESKERHNQKKPKAAELQNMQLFGISKPAKQAHITL